MSVLNFLQVGASILTDRSGLVIFSDMLCFRLFIMVCVLLAFISQSFAATVPVCAMAGGHAGSVATESLPDSDHNTSDHNTRNAHYHAEQAVAATGAETACCAQDECPVAHCVGAASAITSQPYPSNFAVTQTLNAQYSAVFHIPAYTALFRPPIFL